MNGFRELRPVVKFHQYIITDFKGNLASVKIPNKNKPILLFFFRFFAHINATTPSLLSSSESLATTFQIFHGQNSPSQNYTTPLSLVTADSWKKVNT